jgi:hypothetical protein
MMHGVGYFSTVTVIEQLYADKEYDSDAEPEVGNYNAIIIMPINAIITQS